MNVFPEGHPGALRIKSLARNYAWSPGMDSDRSGMSVSGTPVEGIETHPQSPLFLWKFPKRPRAILREDSTISGGDRLLTNYIGPA